MINLIIPITFLVCTAAIALWFGSDGCRCGHESEAHKHYRPGSDCSLCGCVRFQGWTVMISAGRRLER